MNTHEKDGPMPRKSCLLFGALTAVVLTSVPALAQCPFPPSPWLSSRNLLVGVKSTWGGIITNITPNRTCQNLVNNGLPDNGREVQVAFRRREDPPNPDCWVCSPGCNNVWNPTQGGSPCNGHSSILLAPPDISLTEIHTKAQIYNFDDDDGLSNIVVDQWTSIPKAGTIQLDYRATNLESFSFTDCQEFPVAYWNTTLSTAYSYTGGSPFTNGTPTVLNPATIGHFYPPERWAAWIGSDGYGMGLYIPTVTPDKTFFTLHQETAAPVTNAMTNFQCFTMNPGDIKDKRAYLIYGTLDQIRSVVYEYENVSWFHDVDFGSGYRQWINKLFRNGVTGGCGGANYCPNDPIPREQMAVFLVTAKNNPGYVPPNCSGTPPFTDVQNNHPYCKWIKAAKEQGIMLGGSNENCTLGNGYFCPSGTVTRAHMAAFLLRAKEGPGYNPPACGVPMFGDVPAGDFYCRWIEEIARRGITGGCGGGNYCPTDPNTRAQMAVFISVNWALQ